MSTVPVPICLSHLQDLVFLSVKWGQCPLLCRDYWGSRG